MARHWKQPNILPSECDLRFAYEFPLAGNPSARSIPPFLGFNPNILQPVAIPWRGWLAFPTVQAFPDISSPSLKGTTMKTSQPDNNFSLTAVLAITVGLLTGALWSSQPAAVDAGSSLREKEAVIDPTIPSITITAKRLSKGERERLARETIDPAVPHVTVIGYRERSVASTAGSL